MSYNPIITEPQKDDSGIFHCENCGKIISYKAHYCDNCKAKRSEKINMFFKKYSWIIAFIIIILFILIVQ